MKQLHSLEPVEISLVPRGANNRKFLILKSKDGQEVMSGKDIRSILSSDPKVMAAVEKVLKKYSPVKKAVDPKMEPQAKRQVSQDQDEQQGPLDERAQAALKAVTRILTPFKDQLSPMMVHEVLDAAGIKLADADQGEPEMKKSSTMSPEKVKEEHQIDAMKVAKAAYKSHLAKLGYKKYPDAEMAQKDMSPEDEETGKQPEKRVIDESGQEDEQMGKAFGQEDEEDMDSPDVHVHHTHEHVTKSLLAKLPKELRGTVENIFKSNESLAREVKAIKAQGLKQEMIKKSASFKHLGVNPEETTELFTKLHNADPALLETVEKMFGAFEEQASKGALFSEIGSALSGAGKTTWEKIEKAAEGMVKKSGEKCTTAQAVDQFLETEEGKRMYNDYMSSHASSK